MGVLAGLLGLIGVFWLLLKTLGNTSEAKYAGQSLSYWRQQLDGRDTGASNQAYVVVNGQIVPRLIDAMFHDTDDSKIRMAAVDFMNSLPGIQIYYLNASGRRSQAASSLGELGPAAKAALPALLEALTSKTAGLQASAVVSLGKIHSAPEVVIPLLIPLLTNEDCNAEAATALGDYGSLARAAAPQIVPMLKPQNHRVLVLEARDRDVIAAARAALKKIDPAAAAQAGVK